MQDLGNPSLKYKPQGSDRKGSKRIWNDRIVDPFFRRVKGSDRIVDPLLTKGSGSDRRSKKKGSVISLKFEKIPPTTYKTHLGIDVMCDVKWYGVFLENLHCIGLSRFVLLLDGGDDILIIIQRVSWSSQQFWNHANQTNTRWTKTTISKSSKIQLFLKSNQETMKISTIIQVTTAVIHTKNKTVSQPKPLNFGQSW